jgi:PKHD-type hydroxylase
LFYFHPTPLANYSDYAFYTGIFSKDECAKILGLWNDSFSGQALTGGEADSLLTHTPSDIRKSKISWIGYSPETEWLFRKLHAIAFDCNMARYGFDLSGFIEHLQLTRYDEGDKYDWHQDSGPAEFSTRKLSMVIQLSDPAEYEGGSLEFLNAGHCTATDLGDAVLFPSYQAHRVAEITRGTRYSLVAWIKGHPYR